MCFDPVSMASVAAFSSAGGVAGGTAAVLAAEGAAATMGAISTGVQIAGVGMQAMSAMNASNASADYSRYNAQIAENNVQYATWAAEDAMERGNAAISEKTRQAAALKGTQIATMAARGLDLSEGTPLNIQSDTDIMLEQDVATLKDNAKREAWSAKVKGSNSSAEAALLRRKAENENPWLVGAGTALSGLGSVASRWYTYGKHGADTTRTV
jgi:hypothetical protein